MTTVALLTMLALLPTPTAAEQTGCAAVPEKEGCAVPGRIWINPGLAPIEYREVLGHEAGHQVDYQLMTDGDRDTFRRINNDPRAWRDPPNSPHEQFAEAFLYCTLPHRLRVAADYGWDWGGDNKLDGSGYDWRPTWRRAKASCQLVDRVLNVAGLKLDRQRHLASVRR